MMQTPTLPSLSIVIPVLNEAATIDAALQALAALRARGTQVIVVDGGSVDATLALVNSQATNGLPGLHVLSAPPGRARQMSVGAENASGDLLLFLHADTRLPADADRLIAQAMAGGAPVWGRFDVRIVGRAWLLPVIAAFMNTRSRWSSIATGDQAMFMTRAAYDAVGGFSDQPLMEDIDLSARLLKLSRPACLRAAVLTSGRRWEERGVWRTMALMWRLRFAYWRGVAPERLARLYR